LKILNRPIELKYAAKLLRWYMMSGSIIKCSC